MVALRRPCRAVKTPPGRGYTVRSGVTSGSRSRVGLRVAFTWGEWPAASPDLGQGALQHRDLSHRQREVPQDVHDVDVHPHRREEADQAAHPLEANDALTPRPGVFAIGGSKTLWRRSLPSSIFAEG